MRVLIKGNVAEISAALQTRGITWKWHHYSAVHNECMVEIDDQWKHAIYQWFNEPPDEAPYPSGTVLWFTDTPKNHVKTAAGRS